MSWQTSTINPATTSPATDITKITNDLAVLKNIISNTGTDSDFATISFGYPVSATGSITAGQSFLFGINGSQAAGSIYSDANWGCILRAKQASPSIAEFSFQNAGGSERLRVANTGNLLVGGTTDDASNKLQITGGAKVTGAMTVYGAFELGSVSGSSTPFLDFHSGATAVDYDARIIASGGTGVTGGGALTVNASLFASSCGLSLGNVANASATVLDWYEEGTFTPVIVGASTGGTGTYTVQVGKFTRIGNVVHYTLSLTWTAHTGTGGMIVQGLPYAASTTSTPAANYSSLLVGSGKELAPLQSSTQVSLFACDPAGAANTVISMDTAGTLCLSGSFFV